MSDTIKELQQKYGSVKQDNQEMKEKDVHNQKAITDLTEINKEMSIKLKRMEETISHLHTKYGLGTKKKRLQTNGIPQPDV